MLRNTGGVPLTVSTITVSGSGFALSGFTLPLTINAGASFAGTVTFAPKSGGTVTGSLTITSNSESAAAPIILSATGVAPSAQLALTPTSIAFGNIITGQSLTQQLTLRNTGTASLHVTAVATVGSGYSLNALAMPLTLAAGTSTVANVVFAPTATGAASGSITFTSDSSSAVPPVALTGTGVAAAPQISVTPNSMVFGNVVNGQTATTPLTLKNTGTANLNITAVTATGAGYSVNGFILPLTLSPATTAVGNVVFAPTTSGAVTGSIIVTSNSANPASAVSLSGTGIASPTYQLRGSVSSLNFGNVAVGSTSSLSLNLTNTGTGSVSVTSVSVAGTGYSVPATFPINIPSGASRTVVVSFTPALTGAANGSVAFVSNATNSPTTITLGGAGQSASAHWVDVSWTPSTSSVSGYNVYRSTVSGGPYTLLNSSPVAGTSYTDSSLLSGTTYYYVVRSVDASGTESTNSTEVSAVIP
jgi:Abnormal spindle-like microcephaly-assoc'd, ASPM-SPD-2-Hydin